MPVESEHHDALNAQVTIVIVAVILLLTLLFEGGHHWLAHKFHHDRHLIQFVHAFYRVLTLLGLIGLSLFSLIYFGYVKYINDKLFGRDYVEIVGERELLEEGEPPYLAPTEFAEIVEDIQTAIFTHMCLYILLGISMTIWLTWERHKWRKYDLMPYSQFKWLATSSTSRKRIQYWALKQRFLYPKSILAYRTRFANSIAEDGLHEIFSDKRHSSQVRVTPETLFSHYLTECYADLVTKIVRLSPAMWISALLLLLLGLPFYGDKILITYIMIGWSILVLISSCLVLESIVHATDMITPSITDTREAIAQSASEEQARILMPESIPLNSHNFVVDSRNQFFLTRWFRELTEGRKVRGSQEDLLPFGSKGQSYLVLLTQVLLFLQVIAVAFSLTRLINPWWTKAITGETERLVAEGSPGNKATGYIMLGLPGLISLLNIYIIWPRVIMNLMLVTSLERMISFPKLESLDLEMETHLETAKQGVIQALKSLTLMTDGNSRAPDKFGSDIFLALPGHLRHQLLNLHKLIRERAVNGGGGLEVARILNAPEKLYSIFVEAEQISDRAFIAKLLSIAYDNEDQEKRGKQASIAWAQSVFDKMDTNMDSFLSVEDVHLAIGSQYITLSAIRYWWKTDLAVSSADHHISRNDFVDYFSSEIRDCVT